MAVRGHLKGTRWHCAGQTLDRVAPSHDRRFPGVKDAEVARCYFTVAWMTENGVSVLCIPMPVKPAAVKSSRHSVSVRSLPPTMASMFRSEILAMCGASPGGTTKSSTSSRAPLPPAAATLARMAGPGHRASRAAPGRRGRHRRRAAPIRGSRRLRSTRWPTPWLARVPGAAAMTWGRSNSTPRMSRVGRQDGGEHGAVGTADIHDRPGAI